MSFSLNLRKRSTRTAVKQPAKNSDSGSNGSFREISQLKVTIEEKNDEISTISARNQQLEVKVQSLELDQQKLLEAMSSINLELDQAHAMNKELDKAKCDMYNQLLYASQRLENTPANYNGMVDHLKDQIKDLNETNQVLQGKIDTNETLLEGSLESLKALRISLADSQMRAVSLENLIVELRSERNQREARISGLEGDLYQSKERCKQLEVDLNRSRQNLTYYKEKYDCQGSSTTGCSPSNTASNMMACPPKTNPINNESNLPFVRMNPPNAFF